MINFAIQKTNSDVIKEITRMAAIKGSENCEFWLKLMRAYEKAMAIGKRM